jgi:SAM-dependent methyltransferase
MTQYDAIGRSYERLKREMPLARFPERSTFEHLTVSCRGKDVLDLACGTGWYTRKLLRAGAAGVTGADISAEMVDVARRIEQAEPLGARYLRSDARKLGTVGRFDVVTAVWLLCYAETRADLAAMAGTAFDNLDDGGVYLGIEMNPCFDWHGEPATRYGLTHVAESTCDGGKRLAVTAHVDPPISFNATFWEAGPIVRAFLDTGFRSVEFVAPVLGADGVAEFGEEFWAGFRSNPTILGIRAVK